MEKLKKTDWFLLILFLILVMITLLAWKFPNVGEIFNINNWFGSESYSAINFWAAMGFVILVCFIGAIIPVPIPYAIPVSTFAFQWVNTEQNAWLMITLMVIIAALSNTIGDSLDYLIGRGSQIIVKKDDPNLQNRWAKIILRKPKAIPFIIFLFALTPLPDSLLLVPLGMIKYKPKYTIISMFIGKIFMMLAVALAGIFGIQWLLDIIGGEGSWVSGALLLWAMWFIIVLMIKIKPKEKDENSN